MTKKKKILLSTAGLILSVFLMALLPFRNPVKGGTSSDYHPQSFWYDPWGTSVSHKGVDIFKRKGTPVRTAYPVELVLYAGHMPGKGGNAANTPPHLHFGATTLYPRLWDIDDSPLVFQKCFYLNPIPQLNKAGNKKE